MSDHRSFAIVTAALHAQASAAVQAVIPGAAVRIGSPRAPVPGETSVALTLYHLAANTALRHAVPGYRPGDVRPTTPPLAFDLRYMVSIASEQRLVAERLLGTLVTTFARQPVLTPTALAAIVAAGGDWPELTGPPPAEPVRLTPLYPTPAEASALWSGLFMLPGQPSLHIVASPVLIAVDDPSPRPLPVLERDR